MHFYVGELQALSEVIIDFLSGLQQLPHTIFERLLDGCIVGVPVDYRNGSIGWYRDLQAGLIELLSSWLINRLDLLHKIMPDLSRNPNEPKLWITKRKQIVFVRPKIKNRIRNIPNVLHRLILNRLRNLSKSRIHRLIISPLVAGDQL